MIQNKIFQKKKKKKIILSKPITQVHTIHNPYILCKLVTVTETEQSKRFGTEKETKKTDTCPSTHKSVLLSSSFPYFLVSSHSFLPSFLGLSIQKPIPISHQSLLRIFFTLGTSCRRLAERRTVRAAHVPAVRSMESPAANRLTVHARIATVRIRLNLIPLPLGFCLLYLKRNWMTRRSCVESSSLPSKDSP